MLSPHDPVAGPAFEIRGDAGPLIGTAVHAGHVVRPEVSGLLAVSDDRRRYEEDPYSDRWAGIAGDVAIVVHRSRFECDLDRPRVESVYRGGDDAWGLAVWSAIPTEPVVGRSLTLYDAFYAALESVLIDAIVRCGCFALLDFHSYNHRRGGPDVLPDDAGDANPEINVGTGGLPRHRWGNTVDGFVAALSDQEVDGFRLDVRPDVCATGGHLVRWVNSRFGENGLALAVSVKKIYMDEHTGELIPEIADGVETAVAGAAAQLVDHLIPA